MRVAIRCIYQKAVTPSCDIVYMDKETYLIVNEFMINPQMLRTESYNLSSPLYLLYYGQEVNYTR